MTSPQKPGKVSPDAPSLPWSMAAVAATASWTGRYASGVRVLSLAVTGLVLIDPLLVWSMGFRLSVAASASLVTLARPLGRALRGPRVVIDLVAASIAAQVATAPLLVGWAGPVPALGVVWNVLAVPVLWLTTTPLAAGLSVAHDTPYRGGYTTAHYGRPDLGVHVVQVELARRLYMDEATLRRSARFEETRRFCAGLVAALAAVPRP